MSKTDPTPGVLSQEDYELFQTLVQDRFGIHLTQRKRTLLSGRLARLMSQGGYDSAQDLYEELLKGNSQQKLQQFANSVTTNYTYFNREAQHFEHHLGTSLPEITGKLQKENSKDLRVWCAAASSGEEPYMLAMLQQEHLGTTYPAWSAGVLATDISEDALGRARAGIYPADSAQKLPASLRNRYMAKQADGRFQVSPRVRDEVTFRRLNLMRQQLPFHKPFHAIFCRNVMIYFDQETRDALVKRMFRHTAIGGYLYIGLAETLERATTPYTHIAPGIYRREH